MHLMRIVAPIFLVFVAAGCTTVANPGPNAQELSCPPGEHEVCSGATATRIERRGRDPFAVCHCEPRSEGQYEDLPDRY